MPLYPYRCATCEADFELLRRWSEANVPAECPVCKTPTGVRQLSAPAPTPGSSASVAASGGGGGCSPRGGFT